MFKALQKRWGVRKTDLLLILFVFAITGTTTAFLSKVIPGWVGFDDTTHWIWKLLLRLLILIFGYQAILLAVAFLFGQFPFFWKFEKRFLQRLGFLRKESESTKPVINVKDDQKTGMKELSTENRDQQKVRLAVFASGAGSNAEKLIHHFTSSDLAEVALVVCNKPGAGVLDIAKREGVPILLIEKERFFRGDGYVAALQEADIDFIVLAGFLWKVPASLINAYPRRIVNIHPALLPKFGGKGMYGQYVHEAVLQAGEAESGITIHYVDEHYDNGDVIFQAACPVLPTDSPADVAWRVHELEHLHYPKVVEEVIKIL